MVCVWLGKSAICHFEYDGTMHGTSQNRRLVFFLKGLYLYDSMYMYVYMYIYIYTCTSLLGKKLGEDSSKIQCRNKLLSNKIVIVEFFSVAQIVFKENNGRFFQFFVVELLLHFFDQISPCFL